MSNDGSNITTSTTGQISMRNFIDEVQTISTPTTTVGMKQFGDKQWFIDFDRDQGAPGKSNSIVLTKHNAMTIGVDDLVGSASENNPDNWSAAPYGLQEFTSFDQANPFIFGTSNTANTNSTQTGSLMSNNSITTASCFAFLRVSLSVWCMRVGSDLVWYMTGGRFASNHNSGANNTYIGTTALSSGNATATEIARIAGADSDCNVSVSYSTLQQSNNFNQTQTFTASLSETSGTPTFNMTEGPTALTSTNTRLGYNFSTQNLTECAPSGDSFRIRLAVDWTITLDGVRPRTFRMFVHLFGTATTTGQCC